MGEEEALRSRHRDLSLLDTIELPDGGPIEEVAQRVIDHLEASPGGTTLDQGRVGGIRELLHTLGYPASVEAVQQQVQQHERTSHLAQSDAILRIQSTAIGNYAQIKKAISEPVIYSHPTIGWRGLLTLDQFLIQYQKLLEVLREGLGTLDSDLEVTVTNEEDHNTFASLDSVNLYLRSNDITTCETYSARVVFDNRLVDGEMTTVAGRVYHPAGLFMGASPGLLGMPIINTASIIELFITGGIGYTCTGIVGFGLLSGLFTHVMSSCGPQGIQVSVNIKPELDYSNDDTTAVLDTVKKLREYQI